MAEKNPTTLNTNARNSSNASGMKLTKPKRMLTVSQSWSVISQQKSQPRGPDATPLFLHLE